MLRESGGRWYAKYEYPTAARIVRKVPSSPAMGPGAGAGALGNLGTQALLGGACSQGFDFESAALSALADGLGGFAGGAFAGITSAQGLPVLTPFGADVVSSSLSGAVAGVSDVVLH
jgi:hypothetical protein